MPIETKNLSVAYNECHLIKGISIKFESSQITSIIGPNGCGKSTLLNSLGANLLGHNGQIFVDGRDFSSLSPNEKAKFISFMPQSLNLEGDLLVEDFFHYSRFPQMESFRNLLDDEISLRDQICLELNISHLLLRKIRQVSGGELKKIAIGAAFFHGGQYVLLDEPFQALDPVVKSEVARFLKGAVEKYKCGIVMSCHDLYWAQELSESALLLKSGEILAFGSIHKNMNSKMMEKLYGEKFVTYTQGEAGDARSILVPKGVK